MGWGLRTGVTAGVVVVLMGGYLVADAYDVVPGMLTVEPAPPAPAPFPTAPGALAGPAPERTLEDLPVDAPSPAASVVGASVAALAGDARLGPQVSALVVDATSGDVLGAAADTTVRVPASTQKLLTAVAALTAPGATTTLPTRAVLDDSGAVVLVGGGDMMLAADAGDPDAVNGHAGLGDLADQTAAALTLTGRTSVVLHVDDTLFTGPAVAPSWDPANVAAGFAAPVAALAVDVAKLGPEEYARREADPAMAAARTFAARLAERGITVTGSPSRGVATSDGQTLGEVTSAPLDQVVHHLLQHSDNTITEVVGRLVAIDAGLPGSVDGATQAVLQTVGRLGVDLTGARLTDCSGLGDGSVLTARQLVDVLRLAVSPAYPALREVAVGMPVAGLTGTLDDRYLGDNAGRGVVRAKTGSLPGVTALAGSVVTDDDRMLVFAVLADAVPDGGSWGARRIVDQFVGGLAACGCQTG